MEAVLVFQDCFCSVIQYPAKNSKKEQRLIFKYKKLVVFTDCFHKIVIIWFTIEIIIYYPCICGMGDD